MTINRRQFVEQTTRAAVAAGTVGVGGNLATSAAEADASASDAPLPMIDTHQHLWDLSKFRLPWLKSAETLNRSFLTADYLAATEGLGVVKTVYMEVDVEPKQHVAEAEHVIALCRRHDNPMAAAVIGGRPGADDFRQYVAQFKNHAYVKGVRQVLFDTAPAREKAYVAGLRLLGSLGMSFDLCLPPKELLLGADLARQCPDVRFILDHCGNADPKAFSTRSQAKTAPAAESPAHDAQQWRRDIAKVARQKNVVCKISGVVARASKADWTAADLAPIVNHCLEVFGPNRVMFGSDWPVCTRVASLQQWVAALLEIISGRPQPQRRKLLHDNAERFYVLSK